MPFDLEVEIARRLNVPPDTIGPVLSAVIERISQQVSHYGYARVAGLGTFRGQNGNIAFEPDPLLSEEVNLRFAGLEEVRVAAVGVGEEAGDGEALEHDEDGGSETVYGDSPGDDYERHEYEGDESEEPGDEADEDREPAERPEESELEDEPLDLTESEDAPVEWAESEDQPDGWAESEDEPDGWAESEDEPDGWAEFEDEPVGSVESEDEPLGWVESGEAPIDRPESEGEPIGWAESGEEPDEDEDTVEELYAGPASAIDSDVEAEVPGAEPMDDAPESTREPFPWDDHEAELPEMDAPGVAWVDDDDELIESATETDTGDEWLDNSSDVTPDEVDEPATWLERPVEDHPLGPVPDEPFEEADYSVLEEQRTEAYEDSGEGFTPYGSSHTDMGEDDDVRDLGDLENDNDDDEDIQPEFGNRWDENYDEDIPDTSDEDDEDGPTVEWSPLEEESGSYSVEENYADEAAMAAAGGMAAGDYDESDEHVHHDTAPDREALPHERIRQRPPKRHTAARATGGGAAGGNRSAIWIGVGIIVVIAAAAIAYFTILPTTPTDEPPLAEQTEPPMLADTSAAAEADATRADTTAEAIPPPVEEEAEESTPLRSVSGIDTAEGGFTIIVYSETSRSGAEDVAARYRDAGFRTSVLEYQESGATRYRVGVGQFTTLNQAAEARDDLAGDELPDDAWVRRVQ